MIRGTLMNRLKNLAINDEGFIFDPITGESFTANRTGLFILKGLKDGLPENEIAQKLSQNFDVSFDEAQRDVLDFLEKLRSYRLI